MKAVFVFCEGNHDVKFTVRSLGQVAHAKWLGQPIKELPSPLGPVPDPANPLNPKVQSIVVKRYSGRMLDDLHLQSASHAAPPAFEAVVQTNDTLFVLVRCHGDGASAAATQLINDVQALVNPGFGTDVTEVAAAFLFDADASIAERETRFTTEYATLLGGLPAPKHAAWVKPRIPVGLYVFCDNAKQEGTLENVLAPLVQTEWPRRWESAGAYLTQHADPHDPVSKKEAERLKAQISIAGQFRVPGDPMSEVIGRNGLPDAHFMGQQSQALVTFLQGVPW